MGRQMRFDELRPFESCARDELVSGLCTLDERTLIAVVRNVAIAHIDTVSGELRHAGRFANEHDRLIYFCRPSTYPLLVNSRRLVVASENDNNIFELQWSNGCKRWLLRRTLALPKGTVIRYMQFDAESGCFVLSCKVPSGWRDEYRVDVLSNRFIQLMRLPLKNTGERELRQPLVSAASEHLRSIQSATERACVRHTPSCSAGR